MIVHPQAETATHVDARGRIRHRLWCAWCGTECRSTTNAGWPICDPCWDAGEDGYPPPAAGMPIG